MATSKNEIYLIDGSAYIYRAYHATGGLSNSQGFPTGAVFGFTNMIVKTLRDKSPSRIAVVFDAKGPTFRHEKYTEYKANRPEMPDDLRLQIPKIHEVVDAYRLPSLSVEGFEADDIIATLTRQALEKGWKVVIVSADKDLMQLVGDDVLMWDPQRDTVYDSAGVERKFGVPPSGVRDLLALMGDSSDNVPGVPGVGQKTAAKLLREFGSLEQLLARLDDVGQKAVREKIRNHEDKAVLSRDLVGLNPEVPLQLSVEDLTQDQQDVERLRSIFRELEFKRLLDELPPEQGLDYSGYETIVRMEDLDRWVTNMSEIGRFAVDLETTSQEPVRADLVGVSLCAEGGKACYVPVAHTEGTQLPKADVLTALKPILEDEHLEKVGQNIKYDMIVLMKEGVQIRGIACDTMLASYLLDPGRRGHSLDDLAQLFLHHAMIPIKDLIGTGKNQTLFSEVDIPRAATYACEDADATLRVAEILCPRVETEGLGDLFRNIELPLIPVLADMELTGVRVDTEYLQFLSLEFGEMLDRSEQEIYDLAGESFNINSPKQLGVILFDRIGLKPLKKTKTGRSTSLDVLEQLALQHELPKKILEYRSIFKLKSTYVDALFSLVNPKTGRIHTSYNQAVAATGRLSSSDPNLQNIPVRSTEGRKIRRAFIPADDHVFVAADYSQIELRVMAHLSNDRRLKDAFSGGEDIHAITAASVFQVPPAHVTPEMRRKAKAINFGIMYGMGPYRLAEQLGVGLGMARKYLEDYYATYAGVRRYMEEVPEKAAKAGFVSTLLGRKRFLPELNSTNKIAQQGARRVAINTTIQGTAADLIKLAMIKVSDSLARSGLPARMILQVHDELILEARKDAAEETAALLKREMERAYELSVPLVVDAAIGNNWDEAH
ncbi:MAG: DNA polymerase I [Desulfomonilaceae bacterium]|nr:DNA polymerase I [Desulfomonilaceae bacterium]